MSNLDVDQHMMDLYNFKRRIGKGAYGIVWKAIERRTKDVVAVKKIFDAFKNKTDAQRTYREINFLRAFGVHKNIIKLRAVHKANNDVDIYLVFEYMDTDLHNAISQPGLLTDIHKRYVMFQLLNATKFIHSGNVVHRDQKPSNILLDKFCQCKLADFGLARSILKTDEENDCGDNPLTDYVATRWYRPPEVLVGSKRYTKGIDMWSLGCILAEMLLGRAIFPGSSTVDQMERILTVLGPPSVEDIEAICSSGVGIGLLSKPPRLRNPLKLLMKGQPIDAIDLVSRLLVLNPEKRLSANEALNHQYVQKFREDSPVLRNSVLPHLPDDHQWSVEQYRNQLYEELNILPRQHPVSINRSVIQLQHNVEISSRDQSLLHSRQSSRSSVTKKIVEMTNEFRKNCVILPPVEVQNVPEHYHNVCKCKRSGCHRNNVSRISYKAEVPEVAPPGSKFLYLNKKTHGSTCSERNGKRFTSHKKCFLPQTSSSPLRVPSDKIFRNNSKRI